MEELVRNVKIYGLCWKMSKYEEGSQVYTIDCYNDKSNHSSDTPNRSGGLRVKGCEPLQQNFHNCKVIATVIIICYSGNMQQNFSF